ncbi:MAG TPA: DUF881 domain-containing protein [Bacillota bacterium]|nr:DUF881 domain-containing protein [Bacillota bacterium]HNT03859.1 DUF881 domain-containing protein [Bacillota bacterium]HPA54620.1 DUF881 domain-containing protein [Bacillota bacterium]HPX68883.1 DUF881 domain-containing protein [Bacillota bacterium]HQA65211.1 DUF881 domain-containing protein [Bacillota bacterium]
MKNIKYQIAVAVVCMVLGIMVSIQFRTVKQGVGPVSEYRARELAAQLKKVREENVKLQNVKNDYESKIKEFEDTASQGSLYAKILKEELDQARILAGIEDVEGPGITVVVDDLKFSEKVNYPLISYSMLLELLNELNAAGAEAVSINEQRIISTSEIRQIGGIHININTVSFAPPFVFKAIGDPKTLEAALRLREGIAEKLENSGVAVTITQEQLIKIQKYNGVIERKYAKVVKEGESQ